MEKEKEAPVKKGKEIQVDEGKEAQVEEGKGAQVVEGKEAISETVHINYSIKAEKNFKAPEISCEMEELKTKDGVVHSKATTEYKLEEYDVVHIKEELEVKEEPYVFAGLHFDEEEDGNSQDNYSADLADKEKNSDDAFNEGNNFAIPQVKLEENGEENSEQHSLLKTNFERKSSLYNSEGNKETSFMLHSGSSLNRQLDKIPAAKKTELIKGAKSIASMKPFFCNICEKNFQRKDALKLHMLSHFGEKPFVCDICGKAFVQNNKLQRHKLSHSDSRPFSCDICGNSFNRKDKLQFHMLCHSDIKPFTCETCKKSFKRKAHLEEHILSHAAEKSFSCHICQKSFHSIRILKEHILCHSDEKPFACELCQKCFRQKSLLKKHITVHSDVKPFICSLCGKAFRQRRSLKYHHILCHSDKTTIIDNSTLQPIELVNVQLCLSNKSQAKD